MLMIILGVVVVLIGIFIYNKLVRLKAFVQESWSGINVQLKRRYDLIPNLVEVVKQYAKHEQGVFENVARMRSVALGARAVQDKSEAEQGLASALKTLFAVAENYPDLKANTSFLELQKQLSDIENDVQLSRRYYNGAVRNYNMTTQVFPSSLIAMIAGFKPEPFFELSHDAEKEAPRVKF